MLYESDFLRHYGIEGQKWGLRRWQNKDGSLTSEGKKKYDTVENKMDYARRYVLKKMTNKSSKFIKKPLNIDTVKERGGLSRNEAIYCGQLANVIYERASFIEPKITRDVSSAVESSGATMYGLDFRLKQPTSLAAKIGSDAKEKRITFDNAAERIKDSIRYTSVSDDNKFVSNYNRTKASLEDKGYKEITCKNYFEMYKNGEVKHKAVQCVYEDYNGNKFELQFQTPSSQAAKNLKVPLYEERRKSGISEKRKRELERQMEELAESVPYPNDISNIKSH